LLDKTQTETSRVVGDQRTLATFFPAPDDLGDRIDNTWRVGSSGQVYLPLGDDTSLALGLALPAFIGRTDLGFDATLQDLLVDPSDFFTVVRGDRIVAGPRLVLGATDGRGGASYAVFRLGEEQFETVGGQLTRPRRTPLAEYFSAAEPANLIGNRAPTATRLEVPATFAGVGVAVSGVYVG
jgi:hypothetical protein